MIFKLMAQFPLTTEVASTLEQEIVGLTISGGSIIQKVIMPNIFAIPVVRLGNGLRRLPNDYNFQYV